MISITQTSHLSRWVNALIAVLILIISGYTQAKLIAVSVNAEDNFRNLITNSIEQTVDTFGDTIYIDTAENDFKTQYAQIKSYVDVGADAIIILSAGTPDQNRKLFEFAKQVPLVFVNTEPVEDLSTLPNNVVYVGSNEEQSGTLQMEELARLAGYKGNVVMLMGEKNHNAAQMRTLDVKKVLSKYPEMKLLKSETGNWQRNQGYKIVTDWIKSKVDFNILVANNDEMAVGGIMALKDAGLDPKNYLIGGIDATQDALKEMDLGFLDVTVLQDAVSQGRRAVDVSYQMINHHPVDHTVWIPFRLVTRDNYRQYLQQ